MSKRLSPKLDRQIDPAGLKDSVVQSEASRLLEIILSTDDEIRNQSLDSVCGDATLEELQSSTRQLEEFWRSTENLYHRVRCLFFLSAIHRYHLPARYQNTQAGKIPYRSYQHLLERRFMEAIDSLLAIELVDGPNDAVSSALAKAYHELAFQTLADQVRKSVRTVRGNQWMFRAGHPADHPLRIRKELLQRTERNRFFPLLKETTAVRMDFTHSGWSDIFFLGMDFPTGARVINASVNLGVMGRDESPQPPIECYFRVIDQPIIRLVSVDLKASAEIETVSEVFDFAADYLGLLKAAIIAAGIVPPGMEGCGQKIGALLDPLVGPGLGIEIVSKVNDIPKGSRLAVSTNLLGSLISLGMRATGQISSLDGGLEEKDRRIIAARAILGEWIGGSGGGWQDSGGVWPGIKLIQGAESAEGDPEFGVSRGRLLPQHEVFSLDQVSIETRKKLQDSLVLVHGGMAQNVGPILEMVTEKYLLRSDEEWNARKEAIVILDQILEALKKGDIRSVGLLTHRNFFGPLQKIIPWCTNLFTNSLVESCQQKYGEKFWGFWMLGGMAGGGMGFIFDPEVKPEAKKWLQQEMIQNKQSNEKRLPFAMEPVVYDFVINDRGTWGELIDCSGAALPEEYYAMTVPGWLKRPMESLSLLTRQELELLGTRFRGEQQSTSYRKLLEGILPGNQHDDGQQETLTEMLDRLGFDRQNHEQIQIDLKAGRYGLAQNRLSPTTDITDVEPSDYYDARIPVDSAVRKVGELAIANGEVAVMTLSAGVGSRWTEGAGVVKGLHPFSQMAGKHRSFLEVHLAKSKKVGKKYGTYFPHIITTGYLTDQPIKAHLESVQNYGYPDLVPVSPGRYVGLRTIPMVRDLQFEWEEIAQQVLDEQQQKMRDSQRSALMGWAQVMGEGSDYVDNHPQQCLHPVGHWYEVPNLLRNGLLKRLLADQPYLKYLMLHNVDTLGASVDPGLLGWHIQNEKCLTFEVISRRLEDRGGGLARVNGRVRLLEGLAMPREEDEFKLSFYNSMTTWISIDTLLGVFGLTRSELDDNRKVEEGIRQLGQRMPTYITIKDVKKRWGHGQEDIFPVSQFEKLWSDMTGLAEIDCGYLVVDRMRGQQLKEQAQLDSWLR
ncbi:MAG: UTP--glucose-1-phosphate uridylyltransferase, partial [Planctomycetota bacterium]